MRLSPLPQCSSMTPPELLQICKEYGRDLPSPSLSPHTATPHRQRQDGSSMTTSKLLQICKECGRDLPSPSLPPHTPQATSGWVQHDDV